MSVRVTERELSSIEYIKVLRDIEIFFITKQNEKPKKFRYFYSEHLVKHAANAYAYAKIANSIYVENVELKNYRYANLKMAHAEIQALISQTDVLYTAYKADALTPGELETISKQMHSAVKLLNGVAKADKKRYKDIK